MIQQTQSGGDFLEQLASTVEGESPLGCMQCGLCVASCPLGHAMEYPPRKILLRAAAGHIDLLLKSPSVWMCVGCYLCSFRCPRGIELTDGLWPALRDRAMQAGIQPPSELQEALRNLLRYGNVLGKSPRQRLQWAEGLDVPVLDLSKQPQPVEVLWIVGDYPSYYPRNQRVARALARILTVLGVRWGVLGAKESAMGECRMFGEEGLFETLVEKNRQVLQSQQFEKIVFSDPHDLQAFQHYYPRYGIRKPAEHYVTFLADRLSELKGRIVRSLEAVVTYHDNCCVARRCRCFEPPRALLEAIPGLKLVEMERNRDDALCCGGGAGGMWLDAHIEAHGGYRLSNERIKMAARTGAQILAVSCPFELSRFEDAAKVTGLEGKIQVRDIIELLAEAMDLAEKETG